MPIARPPRAVPPDSTVPTEAVRRLGRRCGVAHSGGPARRGSAAHAAANLGEPVPRGRGPVGLPPGPRRFGTGRELSRVGSRCRSQRPARSGHLHRGGTTMSAALTFWGPRSPFAPFGAEFRRVATPARASESAWYVPAADVVRDGEDAVVRLELPGVDVASDVTVEVVGHRLVVRGERRDQHTGE